ncbi:hypothetical protein GOP47_0009961 [Adiantum capillus-veneris]|uniref:Uncharacterized protein n=1 Tax=Adiantum capillus-veneris TaxID=13818 RepID=A0A9D4UXA0_ADICA|nr:hypothetical protein GOP47_0009961 [Adiantum capillus-veneris]
MACFEGSVQQANHNLAALVTALVQAIHPAQSLAGIANPPCDLIVGTTNTFPGATQQAAGQTHERPSHAADTPASASVADAITTTHLTTCDITAPMWPGMPPSFRGRDLPTLNATVEGVDDGHFWRPSP